MAYVLADGFCCLTFFILNMSIGVACVETSTVLLVPDIFVIYRQFPGML